MAPRSDIRAVLTDQKLAPNQRGLQDEALELERFITRASLWLPDHLVPSTWHEHAPFAFWAVEAAQPRLVVELGVHHGFSYFAFCQAIQRLGLDANACAIDTWAGDEHAGFYGEEVFRAVQARNHEYEEFSNLEHSTFADARERFQDGSIDLLHIDGRHFYDDVKYDFETWLPKLSDRAVVLIHDTNVRKPGFGVGTFWREISAAYPSFEFMHGCGLGVLAVGSSLPEPLRRLATCSSAEARCIRSVYARLGSAVSERFKAVEAERVFRAENEARTAEARRLEETWRVQAQESERLRGHLLRLEHERDQYVLEVERLLGHVARFERERDQHTEEFARLSGYVGQLELAREKVRAEHDELRSLLAERDALLGAAIAEGAHLRAHIREGDQLAAAVAAAKAEAERLRSESDERQRALDAARNSSDQLVDALAEAHAANERLTCELSESHRRCEEAAVNSRELAAALQNVTEEFQAISTSTTWRVTGALRNALRHSPSLARILRRIANLVRSPMTFQPAHGLPLRSGWAALSAPEPGPVGAAPPGAQFAGVQAAAQSEDPGPSLRNEGEPDPHAGGSPSEVNAQATADRQQRGARADLEPAFEAQGELPRQASLETAISDAMACSARSTETGTLSPPLDPSAAAIDSVAPAADFCAEQSTVSIDEEGLPEALGPEARPEAAPSNTPDVIAPPVLEPATVPMISPPDDRQRIDALQTQVEVLSSMVHSEIHRINYALAKSEGVIDEIDAYHLARSTPDFESAFLEHEPLVSVCVATVDRAALLVERCLPSLLGQTYKNLQIVVVGDHCTDDTEQRVAELRDSRIVFRNLSERGPYPLSGRDRWCVAGTSAMNKALSLCEGQFIAHLDDDDAALPDRIETLVRAAQSNRADFCWHAFWWETPEGSWARLGNGQLQSGQITTSSIFYHRYFRRFEWDVFAYRLQEPGDWNRIRKIKMLRPRLHFIDRPLVFHHVEEKNALVQKLGERFLD